MDINNYNYCPYLGVDDNTIERFKNDDMEIYISKERQYNYIYYLVYGYSFDGSMEVAEQFTDLETAKILYKFILDNFTQSPPDDNEISNFISKLKGE